MIALSDITESQQLSDDFCELAFNVYRASMDYSWFTLKPECEFEILAGEGSGDVYLAYGDGVVETRPILYVTSEGRAGKIASHFDELLALLLAIPYWHTLLMFSGNGDLDAMRETADIMEREHAPDYLPQLEAASRIRKLLPIPAISDPIRVLHHCIHSTDCTAVAPDGWRSETLFNSFRPTDNPNWK